jgi:hypothetical protein
MCTMAAQRGPFYRNAFGATRNMLNSQPRLQSSSCASHQADLRLEPSVTKLLRISCGSCRMRHSCWETRAERRWRCWNTSKRPGVPHTPTATSPPIFFTALPIGQTLHLEKRVMKPAEAALRPPVGERRNEDGDIGTLHSVPQAATSPPIC